MESNQFQRFLSDELIRRSREAGVYVPVSHLNNTTDKLGRIQRLQPLIRSGTLRLSRRHVTLLDQLRHFPMGAADDGPDALEMAVRTAGCGLPAAPWVVRRIPNPPQPFFDDRRATAYVRKMYFGE